MSAPAPRRRRPGARLLAAVALLLLLATACGGSDESTDDMAVDGMTADDMADEPVTGQAARLGDGDAVGLAAEEAALAEDAMAEDEMAEEAVANTTAEAPAGGGEAAEGADVDVTADQVPPALPPGTAVTGERIIKEGTVTIEVAPGDFDAAFGQVITRAQELGGHVAGSSSATSPGPDDRPLVSGQVTIRVPVRSFEDLIRSIGDAGAIVERSITSQDVTAEYVDLESRRRNLQAQERFYLGLLDDAQAIPDAIAVQQQLDDIQAQIEQITGRLNLLQDRSAFSTLTVRIREQGAEVVEPFEEEGTGLAPYLRDAADTLVATVGSILVVATFLTPFLGLALLGWGAYRLLRPRRPADAARTTPTADTTTPTTTPTTAAEAPVEVGAGTGTPDRDG